MANGPAASSQLDHEDNPFKIETAQEACALYEQMRDQCPVRHTDAAGGFYWITKYADVRNAARDSGLFSSARKGVMLPANETGVRAPVLEMDPPEHSPWRRIYIDALSPKRLRTAEPRLAAIANDLIDRFIRAGECDLMADYAEPYPVLGVCETIGISGPSVDQIRAVSAKFVRSLSSETGDVSEQPALIQELGSLVLNQVLLRRTDPKDDYLTEVVNMEVAGRKLTELELGTIISGFLTAGHESTTSALGTLLFHVIGRSDLKERVIGDDTAMAGAIEESVRLYPPFQAFHRTTTEPVNLSGVTIPPDSTVRLAWGSANRDPDIFDRPNSFDPDRSSNPHLGYGFGRHVCVGAALARLEMRIATRELLRRLPDIRLPDPTVEWKIVAGNLTRPAAFKAAFTPPGHPGADDIR